MGETFYVQVNMSSLWAILLLVGTSTVVHCGSPSCSMGEVCGNGCSGVTGSCKSGSCLDMFDRPEACEPFDNVCGSSYCENNEVCFEGNVCDGNSCANHFKYSCPGAASNLLQSKTCDGNGFTSCASAPGFSCQLGPGRKSIQSSSSCRGSGSSPSSGGGGYAPGP